MILIESQVVSIMQAMDGPELHQVEELERQRLRVIEQRFNRRKALIGKLARDRQLRVDQFIDNWQPSQYLFIVMDEIDAQGTVPTAKERRLIRWARELARHNYPLSSYMIDALNDSS